MSTPARENLKELIDRLAVAAKERVDDPKNVAKGDTWLEMKESEVDNLQSEEVEEYEDAIDHLTPARASNVRHVESEGGDILVTLAMRLDRWYSGV